MIWCAEVALERLNSQEIYGKVGVTLCLESSSHVNYNNFLLLIFDESTYKKAV
ncbi:unnamed protein product [Brassica rapa subsp. trilocularis]